MTPRGFASKGPAAHEVERLITNWMVDPPGIEPGSENASLTPLRT